MNISRKYSAHVFITGRVQGVGFRYYTMKQAQALGLVGWVKNLPNGQVEAVFEGEKPSLAEMIKWCWEGSPTAKVSDVRIEWEAAQGLKSFKIDR